MNRQNHLTLVTVGLLKHERNKKNPVVRNPIYTQVNKGRVYPYNSAKRGWPTLSPSELAQKVAHSSIAAE
jgi:hypothetical protein